MASSVVSQLLASSSGQSLLRSCRWPLSLRHGLQARCVSSKINDTASVIGSNTHHNISRANQLLAIAANNTSSKAESSTENLFNKIPTLSNSEFSLEQGLSRLSLSPLESRLNLDMILPHAETLIREKAILDPSPFASLQQDCPGVASYPLTPRINPLENPLPVRAPTQERDVTKKHASNIIQKRRRKMNRHQYLKWKKRNKFKLRILKQKSRKKKRLRWEQHLSKFRFKELQPNEGEEYLAKRRAKEAIYLRYLGIETDENAKKSEQNKEANQKKPIAKIVPERILPPGAVM
ncbi:uncharacterized protein [Asterias amurensis]|uniref:uncharacterized protein n=1 Tax=Asterias amurensis TaxID=7602 RepID=UPI003AB2FE54